MQVRPYRLTELERASVHKLLTTILLGGDLDAMLQSINLEQSTALHHVMDVTKDPIPETPLWRTLSEEVQGAIASEYRDVEGTDRERTHDDLDMDDDIHSVLRWMSDPELLSAVYNYDCGVDDFRDAIRNPKLDYDDPEVLHWKSWRLMHQAGLCDDEGPTTLGLEHCMWDDERLLEGPHTVYYRTRGVGAAWTRARDGSFDTCARAIEHMRKLEQFYGDATEYRVFRLKEMTGE